MKNIFSTLALCTIMTALIGCGDKDTPSPGTGPGTGTGTPPKVTVPSAASQDPKDAIAYQFELLKAGETDKLKNCFTDRQKERITAEVVAQGKTEAASMSLEDLVASVEMGEFEGKKTAKIMMKGGKRTLTTLIMTDGKWLADTVWFK
ncbi:MAG: hypothetical protein WD768_19010 [Phycisphaeraceae bacterium]